MGLLDDAIRDHLDLKRRRGGDTSEIDRAEQEALGPVRRDPFESAPDGVDAEGAPPAGHEGEEQVFDDEYYEDEEYSEDRGEEQKWDDGLEDEEPLPAVRDEVRLPDPPAAERALELTDDIEQGPAVPAPHPAGRSDETVEYDVRQELEAEDSRGEARSHPPAPEPAEETEPAQGDEPSKEDVLEETPEFLQDTPDHDRLWFEQRPPRDFDFDG